MFLVAREVITHALNSDRSMSMAARDGCLVMDGLCRKASALHSRCIKSIPAELQVPRSNAAIHEVLLKQRAQLAARGRRHEGRVAHQPSQ